MFEILALNALPDYNAGDIKTMKRQSHHLTGPKKLEGRDTLPTYKS